MHHAGTRFVYLKVLSTVLLLSAGGCHSNPWQQWNETIKGSGFPGWNESIGSGVRGKDPNAKPSGFFTDRRSEQIEQNLGGGF
jgi:hypothetical protein